MTRALRAARFKGIGGPWIELLECELGRFLQ